MKFKKLISAMLAGVMALSMMSVSAFAEDPKTGVYIGETQYDTLAAAVDAVTDGTATTIDMYSDMSGDGIKIEEGKNITIDLHEKTYTVDGTTVGSTGTPTNGFQLLKDSTITIKNGTITSDKAKILIQNYSNLTLDEVHLDGSKLVEAKNKYVLSNNNGNTIIKNSTITAQDGWFAFDVCRNKTYKGVTVTAEKSTIVGDIELTDSAENEKDNVGAVTKENFDLTLKNTSVYGMLYDNRSATQREKAEIGNYDGAKISLTKDVAANGLQIPENSKLIIDLCNHTYNINGTTVGSTGTETNGIQILKGSEVSIINGKITSDKAKHLIQNYATKLQLSNIELDGTKLAGNKPYTLSVNNGSTTINNTVIRAKDGGVAFDCYYWPSNGYGDVSVSVNGANTAIYGKIEIGHDATAEHTTLNLIGGRFTEDVSKYLNSSYACAKINGMYQVFEETKNVTTSTKVGESVKNTIAANFGSTEENATSQADTFKVTAAQTTGASVIRAAYTFTWGTDNTSTYNADFVINSVEGTETTDMSFGVLLYNIPEGVTVKGPAISVLK